MGEGITQGIGVGLANMPSWVWFMIVGVSLFLMRPWSNIEGIPRWAWIALGVLAVWALMVGK